MVELLLRIGQLSVMVKIVDADESVVGRANKHDITMVVNTDTLNVFLVFRTGEPKVVGREVVWI